MFNYLFFSANSPTYLFFVDVIITLCSFGTPVIHGNTDRGASSPAKPALTTPDPKKSIIFQVKNGRTIFVDLKMDVRYIDRRVESKWTINREENGWSSSKLHGQVYEGGRA